MKSANEEVLFVHYDKLNENERSLETDAIPHIPILYYNRTSSKAIEISSIRKALDETKAIEGAKSL